MLEIVNEFSERKTPKKGILKGRSQEETIKTWFIHFSSLLGKESIGNYAGEEVITTVLHQPNIKTSPFTVDEYQRQDSRQDCFHNFQNQEKTVVSDHFDWIKLT